MIGQIQSTGAGIASREGHLLPYDAADQDVERLFGVIDEARDAAMFGLMGCAGLRVAEVAQLLVSGKGGKKRIVWLTPFWYAKVTAWLAVHSAPTTNYLFLSQHGRQISKDGIQYPLHGYCAAAGISITCHQLGIPFRGGWWTSACRLCRSAHYRGYPTSKPR